MNLKLFKRNFLLERFLWVFLILNFPPRFFALAVLIFTTFCCVTTPATAHGVDLLVITDTFNFGGVLTASNDYTVEGSLGQCIVDPPVSSSANYIVYAGFWGQQVNLAPQIDGAIAQLGANGTASIDLSSLFSDPDYDPLTLSVSAPTGGARSLSGSTVFYSVGPGFTGSDLLTYSVSDGALTTTGTVSIVDVISPAISGNFTPLTITASTLGVATVPNYASQAVVSDNSGVIASVTQLPVAGSPVGAGSLSVVITATDAAGNTATQTVSAFVQVPSSISTQPASLTVNQGGTATFSVGATGTAPFSYQWRKAGIAISGANSASYTIASAQSSDVASYDVVVTNVAGSATSVPATLSVIVPPSITLQPSDLTVTQGSLAAFNVTASGTAPFTYQWRKGGVNLTAGTSSTLSISAAQPSDVGNYDVILTNPAGSVTSASAHLTVNVPITVTTQPSSVTVLQGASVVFSVSATGTAPITYQWRKGGVNITGATSASYSIPATVGGDAGSYDVVLINAAGSVTSAPATLTVNVPITVTTQPSSLTVNQGAAASFNVSATGSAPISYQWRKGGVDISGATSASYSIPTTVSGDAGSYNVVLTNAAGSVTSTAATLSIITPPLISRPSNLQLAVDSSGTLTAQVQSATPFSYYWKKDGVQISSTFVGGIILFSGVSGSGTATAGSPISLQLLNVNDRSEGDYTLVVTNAFGPVESGSANVTVNFSKAKILEAFLPKAGVNYDLRAYDNGTFSGFPNPAVNESIVLNVRGPAGMTYAWSFISGTLAGGAQAKLKSTSSTLNFASEFPQPPGYYKCTVGALGGGVYTSIKFYVAAFGPEALIPGAGTYEGLLESSDTAVGDGAKFRGLVNLTLTNRGSVSGVVRYTEASPLSGGSLWQRVYRPLSQSFVSKLTPVNGSQNRYSCTPQLGVGVNAALRDLTLEFDCSTTPIGIQARLRDHGSIATGIRADGAISQVNRFNRIGAGLPSGFEGAVGRDIVLSDTVASGTSRSQMYSLVQVLASGRAIWTTRMPGYTGSSSAYLGAIDGTRLEGHVCEFQLVRSPTTFVSENVFGRLVVALEQDGKWKTTFGHGQTDAAVERQSSRLMISGSSAVAPVFQSDFFAQGTNWTGATRIDFSAGNGLRWIKATGSALPAFLTANTPMRLRVTDPLKNSVGNSVSYAWDITLLTNGIVTRPLPVTESGVTPPTLTLRLDSVTGQWTGSYSPANGVRRVLTGAVGSVQSSPTERSRGWVELSGEVPVLRLGTWKLESR